MDLLFLGTSSATPTRARNVSALALQEDKGKGWYLIDCGEGTQHRLLRTPLSLHDLRAIFVTHVHGDHCFGLPGLPGLLASAGMMGRKAALPIIAPHGIEQWLRNSLQMSQSWLGYELEFHAVETLGGWRTTQMHVDTTELSHRVPCYGYRFSEARPDPQLDIARLERDGIPRGPLWGMLARGVEVQHDGRTLRAEDYLTFNRPPRRIVVGGDNDRPGLLADACRDAQVLVHEATYTEAVARTLAERSATAPRRRWRASPRRQALRTWCSPTSAPVTSTTRTADRQSTASAPKPPSATGAGCFSPVTTCTCGWARTACWFS